MVQGIMPRWFSLLKDPHQLYIMFHCFSFPTVCVRASCSYVSLNLSPGNRGHRTGKPCSAPALILVNAWKLLGAMFLLYKWADSNFHLIWVLYLCFPSRLDDFEMTSGVGGNRGGVVWWLCQMRFPIVVGKGTTIGGSPLKVKEP